MKNKKQFTLIELIIVIVVIGILAAMALPKFNGVVRNAKLSAMINDKEVLEKALTMYYQKNDELPLLNEDEELIVSNDLRLTKIVLAEEVQSGDMDTIYKSLKETLTYYNDREETLYRIDLPKIKGSLSKDIKYGHKKHDKDFYVYSTRTRNVYYYDYLVNGNGTIQHSEYDTLLKDNELVDKLDSTLLNNNNKNDINFVNDNKIALGAYHSMKIGDDGNVYSWGDNTYGQLGTGDTINKKNPQKIEFPNNEKIKFVFAGYNYSMAIGENKNLYAWGRNNYGQLGLGNTTNQTKPQKVTFPNGVKPTFVSLGLYHSIALGDDNNLYAWGDNSYGQLGTGNTISKSIPTKIQLPSGIKPISISTGLQSSSMTGDDENIYVWGYNGFGELGLGNTISQNTPKKLILPNGIKPISLSLGYTHSSAIGSDGNLYTWGDNRDGELGLGNTISQIIPQNIGLLNNEIKLNYSSWYYSIGVTKEGDIYCWGDNSYGQLGVGDNMDKLTPIKVKLPNGIKIKAIYVGYFHSMLIGSDNNMYSFGFNAYSQLGTGNTTNQLIPTKVTLP